MGPLSEVAAELYMEEDPDARVTVAISGTGGGFEKLCIGGTVANSSSRHISDAGLARPEVLDFAESYVDNAVEIADIGGFVPLIDEQIEEARAKISELAGGALTGVLL